MFGIPPPNTTERAEFLSQFWPALWSGIVASIFTGIIVGLLLFAWQRLVEDRATRRTYAREVSTLRERLRESIAIPDVFRIDSARGSVPPQAEAAMDALRGSPISLWRDELASEAPFLSAVHQFQRAYAEFLSRAAEYDNRLSQFARTYNGQRGAISANDRTVTAYVLGRHEDIPTDQLSLWLDLPSKTIPAWVEEAYSEAQKDKGLLDSHTKYKAAREALKMAL